MAPYLRKSSPEDSRLIGRAQELLCECQSARSPRELLSSLEKFFALLQKISRNRGLKSVLHSPGVRTSESGNPDKLGPWSFQAFQQFRALLNELLNSGDARLQEASLRYSMRVLLHDHTVRLRSAEGNGTDTVFPLADYQVMISRVLQAESFSDELRKTLLQEYICKYADLRYYFLLTLRKILSEGGRSIASHGVASDQSVTVSETEQHSGNADVVFEADPDRKFADITAEEVTNGIAALRADEIKRWYTWSHCGGLAELGKRVYPLLTELPPPRMKPGTQNVVTSHSPGAAADDSDDDGFLLTASDTDETGDLSKTEMSEAVAGDPCFLQNIKTTKCCCAKQYRLLFQDVWVLFLRVIPLDLSLTQKLLHAVPRTLLPYMSNPLLLSEFFLTSFEKASHLSVSVLALSGLFYLLTKHRLADPDALFTESPSDDRKETNGAESGKPSASSNGVCVHFYRRLYQLIAPASFSVGRRGRFLRLLNVALRSSLLPNSLVAAFVKKCARVACLVSPGISLYLIALVYSLLKKYSAVCLSLVDVHPALAARLVVEGDSFDFSSLDFHAPSSGETSSSKSNRAEETDSEQSEFQCTDDDHVLSLLRRCVSAQHAGLETDEVLTCVKNQARMSLWELELLQNHYHYAVRQLTGLIESDCNRLACRNIDLEDYVGLDLGHLLGREFRAAAKRTCAPVAFKKGGIQGEIDSLDDAYMGWVKRRRKDQPTSRM
ncbi:cbf mak21 family protein [Cystoisospora suis]|uniref:Cbf mak21 family protein n=1 Tax=Cystoisospora suis TaxID=483139 RepID=A0A2C6LB32_9APIC|nr:cbf mak21 family protein [Cystoisospora suis]